MKMDLRIKTVLFILLLIVVDCREGGGGESDRTFFEYYLSK